MTYLLEKVETCFWWGLYDRKPLRTWVNGRLALLGDAVEKRFQESGSAKADR